MSRRHCRHTAALPGCQGRIVRAHAARLSLLDLLGLGQALTRTRSLTLILTLTRNP